MPASDRILRIRAVLDCTGLRQVRINRNGCGWRESEISRWITDPAAYSA